MVTEEKLQKAYKESKEYLESISALELMENTGLFMRDLKRLVNSQHMPAVIITGCLMDEIHRLNTESDNLLLDAKLMESFNLFQIYVDRKFMKKE